MRFQRFFLRTLIQNENIIKAVSIIIMLFLCINLLINSNKRSSRFMIISSSSARNHSSNEIILNSFDSDLLSLNEDDQLWKSLKNQFENVHNLNISEVVDDNYSKPVNLCSNIPDSVKTNISVFKIPDDFIANQTKNLDSYNFTQNLLIGGRWRPPHCKARHRVAIIIPYKDRLDNLNYFMYHMHPFLQRQELDYQIFVVEQANDQLFNKGILMNAGFLEIFKLYNISANLNNSHKYPFDCVIFHDVDLLPEDDRIMYSCPLIRPRHLSVAIDKYKYKMFYYKLVGGVLNFKINHFVKVNGYSNEYWGWGAEDDDMEVRLTVTNTGYERPHTNIAHYKMLKHKGRVKNPKRKQLLNKAPKRYSVDGLNSVKYNLVGLRKYPMYTHYYIHVGSPPDDVINAIKQHQTKPTSKTIKIKNSKHNNITNTSSNNRTTLGQDIHNESTGNNDLD